MKSKFKKGDKVALIHWGELGIIPGYITSTPTEDHLSYTFIPLDPTSVDGIKEFECGISDHVFISWEIYDSPLYKTLDEQS